MAVEGIEQPGDDQQDVEAVPRQGLGQRQRVMQLAELALDPAGMGQGAALGIGQGLPGPAEDPRVVAGDLQGQIGEAALAGLVVPEQRLAGEEPLEAAPAPAVEGGLDALGQLGIRRNG